MASTLVTEASRTLTIYGLRQLLLENASQKQIAKATINATLIDHHLYLLVYDELYEPSNQMTYKEYLPHKEPFSCNIGDNKPRWFYYAYLLKREEHGVEDHPKCIDNFLVPTFWRYTKNAQYD